MFLRLLSYSTRLFCGLFVVLLLSACVSDVKHGKQRFFWPLPVAGVEPKLEYIGFFQSDKDLYGDSPASWLERSVLGEHPPVAVFKSPFYIASLTGQRIAVSDTGLRKVVILDREKMEVRELKHENGKPYNSFLPMGVAASGDGEVFVVDVMTGSILRFGADEKFLDTFVGVGVLGHPVGIAVNDQANLVYVSDAGQHNILVFDLKGNLLYTIGERGRQDGQFNFPTDIDLDGEGNLYVLDTLNFRVQVFDTSGRFVRVFGELGTEPGSFGLPKGLAVSPYGQVYVTDVRSHKIIVFDDQGRYLLSLGDKAYALEDGEVTPGGFLAPRGIDVDAAGRILVVDGYNKMVHRFQYLTEDYLMANPVSEEEIYLPPALRLLPRTPFAPVSEPSEVFSE